MMNIFLKIILALLLTTHVVFSQQKGVLLSSKTDDETDFFRANKRVKITTADGKTYKGRLVIIDDSTIAIDGINIPIESISKIRSMSLTSALLSGIYLVVGTVVFVTGIAVGGYGLLLVPPGIVLAGIGVLIPAIGNNHKKYKWDYKIVSNEPLPDSI